MKKLLFLAFVALFIFSAFYSKAQTQIKFNEIQSVNGNTIQDEDGDFEDWIELINTSTTDDINLLGYGLSDNTNFFKWKFPSYILKKKNGSTYDRILVFASGKDRYSYINHWEMTVNCSDQWKYLVNTSSTTAASNWYTFMNSNWASGAGGIGYGDNDDATTITPGARSVYMQKFFTADTSKIVDMVLAIDYDDGFVAYINGVEIARNNISGTPPAWNAMAIQDYEASMYNAGGKPEFYYISKSQWKSYLINGTNLLSIEVHNFLPTSSDLSAIPFLFLSNKETNTGSYSTPPTWFKYRPKFFHTNFKIDNNGETLRLVNPSTSGVAVLSDQINVPGVQFNSSFARLGDGQNIWKYAYPPTPNQPNNTSPKYISYTVTPYINLASGFYNSPQTVTITDSVGLAYTSIRYTTNGNVPKITDNLYTGPFTVSDTVNVIKARVFDDKPYDSLRYIPGGIANATIFINCPTVLPIISLTIDSLDLYDYNSGIYVEGPNANSLYPHKNANYWQDWERASHIEFYDTNRVKQFSTDGLIGIFGNYTRAKPQKSFDFKVKALYDSASVNYQLFPERSKTNFSNFVLRNAGSDWMDAHLKDEYIHRLTYNNGIYSTSARTVVCYLNGKYWGVYHIREKGDEKFLSDLSGIDKDSIDQIRTAGRDYAANGNMTAFNSMINFFTNTDLSGQANYNTAKTMWNVDNFMTYFATEIYAHNDDWISVSNREYWFNNIKLWRPRGITDAKWNYQLHDIDQGMQIALVNYKTIDTVLMAKTLNNHSMMLSKFLANPEFKRQFINKFFDLFNTSLRQDTMTNTLNRFVAKFQSEMQHACSVWPSNPGMPHNNINSFSPNTIENFNTNINGIRSFITQRKNILKNQIASYWNLTNADTAQITIGVAATDVNYGKVKLNSLAPTNKHWKGTYLKYNQIEAVAIAEPGFVFDRWDQSISFSSNANMTLIQSVVNGDSLIAHFIPAPNIAISELNYKSDPTKNSGDWLELNNYSSQSMDLSGWKIKKVSNGQVYTIPNGTIIDSNNYIVFVSDTNIFRSQYGYVKNKVGPTYMSFNDDGDEIHIINNLDNVMIRFSYSDTNSWPDCARGLGRTLQAVNKVNPNPSSGNNWTCGCMGGSPGRAYKLPCPEPIIFNEINYNSKELATTICGDWIELYNRSDSVTNLSGWTLKDGDDFNYYTFPSGTKIYPHNYLVLVEDTSNFNLIYGNYSFIKKAGPFTFKFSNDKEAIRLYNSAGKIYQSMYYKDNYPWPDSADGKGYTMELINDTLNPTLASNWKVGCPLGSPGSAYVFPCETYTVNELSNKPNIKIYPNPASDYIIVETTNMTENQAYFQIFDLQGRLVVSQKMENNQNQNIPLHNLQKGMYIYRIINSNTTIGAGKLLKE